MSLDAGLAGEDVDLALTADHTSPGGRAARCEEESALIVALGRLPESMKQAVLWRHHERCSFDEIGAPAGLFECRSPQALAPRTRAAPGRVNRPGGYWRDHVMAIPGRSRLRRTTP